MAVDVCSEISSPRISFSHDLKELDFVPIENHKLHLNPTIDFDFFVSQNFPQQISSADELFADGKILPVEIKKIIPPKQTHKSEPQKKRLIEFLSTENDEFENPSPKPFWQFRRSSSVNCENARSNNGGLLRSLHFLTRSNSTGSAPNPKPSPKVLQKQNSLKEASIRRESSSGSSLNQYYPYNNNLAKKPILKKSTSRSYGNGVRINPVLNIPPTYIAKGNPVAHSLAQAVLVTPGPLPELPASTVSALLSDIVS
ncbi:hypothetical protein BUALT_Bualt05G0125100 [Buddleja alternifolia]|uniref:Uncharacterized protein n=1 Tax=Buddleja alternifolia TaxID=168488 RepID=A0AAV6XK84_9LAMI|nr:hypothetical protein BUALT_Bualt05G0125100 [Buddleja alternifolia]